MVMFGGKDKFLCQTQGVACSEALSWVHTWQFQEQPRKPVQLGSQTGEKGFREKVENEIRERNKVTLGTF